MIAPVMATNLKSARSMKTATCTSTTESRVNTAVIPFRGVALPQKRVQEASAQSKMATPAVCLQHNMPHAIMARGRTRNSAQTVVLRGNASISAPTETRRVTARSRSNVSSPIQAISSWKTEICASSAVTMPRARARMQNLVRGLRAPLPTMLPAVCLRHSMLPAITACGRMQRCAPMVVLLENASISAAAVKRDVPRYSR